MSQAPRLPHHLVHLRTYQELQQYAAAFAKGHLNLLLIFGPPGVGKTRALREALHGPVCWIGGQVTPLGIYLLAYQHRHQPMVLDDVDGLYADRTGIRLLKSLCQTEKTKTLSWHTETPALQRLGVPQQFRTTSRLALIGNDWRTLNADVAALEDRGHVLQFAPTALEVHRQAAQWFWDQEIFDLIGAYLPLLERPSLRSYTHAWELKQAGLDWRQAVLCRCLSGVALAVAQLRANPAFTSEQERVRVFVESGAGCRATYFNHAKKLQAAAAAPPFKLTQTSPPVEAVPDADYLDRLRRRFGNLGNG
jgi:hypothetical protein